MTFGAADGMVADAVSMVLVGVMWVLSLAVLAGVAYVMGKWLRNREERRKRPAVPQDFQPAMSRTTMRSVKKAQRRSDNASDLDGYV
ncbi:hypothetical protein [Nesterenkonia muleiensis]|uniref:hypothetical protein n=1 Tax=Nesterenkonia muleiensis TaxID=2282648 RepID=UPI000E73C4F8|nr:hypothetical protein [Nesterenkonia muleiensis]